jgi:hypothetical protein
MNSATSDSPPKANEEDREGGGKGRKRQNYAEDDRMSDAVNEWFRQENQSGSTGKPLRTKEQLANKHNVCLSTFQKYTCKDVSKRTKLGISGGRKSVVSENNFKVITDFAITLDQAPDRNRDTAKKNATQIINKIMELESQLSRKQAANFYATTFKKKLNKRLEGLETGNGDVSTKTNGETGDQFRTIGSGESTMQNKLTNNTERRMEEIEIILLLTIILYPKISVSNMDRSKKVISRMASPTMMQ